MFTSRHFLLLLPALLSCNTNGQLAVINLANGGTSIPVMIGPLDHDHSALPQPDPQPLNAAPPESQDKVLGSADGQGNDQPREWEDEDVLANKNHSTENSVRMQAEDNKAANPTLPNTSTMTMPESASIHSTSTSTSTSTTTMKPTSTSTSSTTTMKPTTKISSTTPGQPQSSPATAPPLQSCHQSCLEALNSTHLIPNESVAISVGSSLTLECHMPRVPDLILEEFLWLFHPEGSPEGRCSLTSDEHLRQCPGFPAVSETDYSNDTYLQQVLTLSGLSANHTGNYMCQVKVTCCAGSEQHPMAQQREAQVTVTVWWTDYTVQLAVTGVVAAVLLLALIGVSLYGWRQGREGDNYEHLAEVEAQGVLHLPLIDDQDTDSFDSSIMDEQE